MFFCVYTLVVDNQIVDSKQWMAQVPEARVEEPCAWQPR